MKLIILKIKLFYNLLSIILICIFLYGCGNHDKRSSIEGMFVFESNRNLAKGLHSHIFKNGTIKLLSKDTNGPVFSPNGTKIACSVNKKNKLYNATGILLVDDNGKELEFLRTEYYPISLSWFPSGNKIAYVNWFSEISEIRVYDLETSSEQGISKIPYKFGIFDLNVSPSGKKIMFSQSEGKTGEYIINVDGSGLQFIGDAILPAWHPDGKHIIFHTNVDKQKQMLTPDSGFYYKMNVESGEVSLLRKSKSFIRDLKVSRDGNYLYYSIEKYGGELIAFSPINDDDKEIYVSKPVQLAPGRVSKDQRADWYQGE